MRLAVINLTAGDISGGYLKYLTNMLPRMSSHTDIESILCAVPPSLKIPENLDKISNLEIVSCKPYRPYNILSDKKLKINLKNFKPDIIFIPIERYLKYNGVPVVTMLQNMEPFVARSNLNSIGINSKLSLRKYISQKALKKADGIISLSQFVNSYITKELKIPKSKSSIIHHGIDQVISNKVSSPKILNNFSDEFIFTAGSIRPARGLEDLIEALNILKEKDIRIKLIIAGNQSRESNKYLFYLKNMINNYKMSDMINFIGNINSNEMSWCYQNSKLFIMTSRVESFGMIAGEAMSNGCLCLSSLSPCLPEIFKDSAIYYENKDFIDLADKINDAINLNDKIREKMSFRAINRAKQFSWDVCVNKTVSFLKQIVQNNFS